MKRVLTITALLAALTVAVLQAVASYPSSVKSFSTRVDGQTIAAAWFNEIQDEIVAVENGLLNGIAHIVKPLTDNAYDLGTSALRWKLVFHGPGAVGAPSVSVSEGDVGLYSSGTNALDFTTNGVKALGIDSTQFIDSPTQPRAVAYHNTTQLINDATITAINLNSEDLDVGSMHDTATNNSRITIPTGGDGLYLVVGKVSFTGNATGYREIRVRKNGTTALDMGLMPVNSVATATVIQVTWMGPLVATDYIEVVALQTSGGPLSTGDPTRYAGNSVSVVKLW